jgi:hypothetical protein
VRRDFAALERRRIEAASEQRAELAQARAQLSEANVNLHYLIDELARNQNPGGGWRHFQRRG